MALSKTFIQTWRKWIRLEVPTRNLPLNSAKVTTYEVELDHLRSYVHSLGNGVIESRNYNFKKLASAELERLNILSLEIESCDIAETEKKELQNYVSTTRLLLEEIKTSS